MLIVSRLLLVTGACAVLSACAPSQVAAPVDGLYTDEYRRVPVAPTRRPVMIDGNSYQVKRGDTLYSIAFNSGNDVPTLALLNGISPPFYIYPGQVLRLDASSLAAGSGRSAGTYEVRRGDTLSSIGRQFDMTPQQLAMANNMSAPYTLQVGQVLNVQDAMPVIMVPSAPVYHRQAPEPVYVVAKPKPVYKPQPAAKPKPAPTRAQEGLVAQVPPKAHASGARLRWHWPAQGRIVAGFSGSAEQGNKGIDIAGKSGQPIYAAGSGKVVYAGNALRGYGRLIILKHDEDYLSAYAHNDALLVKEGDNVKAGAAIAKMGSTDAP
ncbi:MAG: LysM peptidoglycan-binding domain-containing protein, partial [Aeromonas sp.]